MGLLEILRGEEPGPIKKLLNYQNKGQFGEYLLEYAVTNHNIPGNLYVFHNLYIPWQGRCSEIDLLMLHEKGIFVFESKNYSGWIFGNETDLNWTQSFSNGEKYYFYNPIRQNFNHIKALAAFLKISPDDFYSCIVFSERCSLRSVPWTSDEYVILQSSDVVKWIKSALDQRVILYSWEQLTQWANLLSTVTEVPDHMKEDHVEQIANQFKGELCPFCGSPLVLRNGKYGEFLGCSSYPKCRFTRKVDF